MGMPQKPSLRTGAAASPEVWPQAHLPEVIPNHACCPGQPQRLSSRLACPYLLLAFHE